MSRSREPAFPGDDPLTDRELEELGYGPAPHGGIARLSAASTTLLDPTGEPLATGGVGRGRGGEADEIFEVLTARELCALPDNGSTEELVGPLLVRGNRTVLGGDTGSGKTTFSLVLLGAAVTGCDFLGFAGAGGCRALMIDAEQGLRTIKRRLKETGLDDSESVDYVRVPDGLALDRNEAERQKVEAILATGYDIVVADPLYKFHRGDSNVERAAVDLMRVFDTWREQFRFALVLNIHTRKPLQGARFTMNELFGSGAFVRGAEVVIGLQFVRSGYSRLHFFKDRDGDLPARDVWGLLFDAKGGYRRDPEDGKPKATARDKVREVLIATPNLTESQLVEATNHAERTVRDALKNLGAIGEPGPRGSKTWSLPEEEP